MREYSHDETSAEFAADFSLFWRVGARIRGGGYIAASLKATNTLPLRQNYCDKYNLLIAYRQCLLVCAGWFAQTTKEPAFTRCP